VACAALTAAIGAFSAPAASAGPGYQLDSPKSSIPLAGQLPHGVAVDQSSQSLYVAELTTDFMNVGHGQIEQFSSTGAPTANSPFVTGGDDFFAGVGVNPVNGGIYGYQTQLSTPFGLKGAPRINSFSSTGVSGASFIPNHSTGPQLAVGAAGQIFFPDDSNDTVEVLSSTGSVEETITCTACTGGAFVRPQGAALDGAGNLYVLDLGGERRVLKFKLSAGSYAFDSVLQSGKGAVAVGVDPASNDVLVGDYAEGVYDVVAYDSSGAQFDDFGAGTIGEPPFGIETSGQIAASETTHKVYVSDPSGQKVWVFARVSSIPAPAASTSPATAVGQVEATLAASVNPKGHRLLECDFEYTTDSDFQQHAFANAAAVPCPSRPGGTQSAGIVATLNGLTPGTVYQYRIVAVSNGGMAEGAAEDFKTLPALAPTVTTGPASGVTKVAATVAGTVNPHGGPVSDCHFEYTKQASFEAEAFANALSAKCESVPKGTTANSVTAKLNTLATGTEYRFRLVATNNAGTGAASPQAFVTQAETCATNLALCPPPVEAEQPVGPPATVPAPPKKPLKCRKGFKKKTVHGKRKCVKIKKRKRARR
jgi:hypothetical protein